MPNSYSYKTGGLIFSALSAGGVYLRTEKTFLSPGGRPCPVIRDSVTGEYFYLRADFPLSLKHDLYIERWRAVIQDDAHGSCVLWPSDTAEYAGGADEKKEEKEGQKSLFAAFGLKKPPAAVRLRKCFPELYRFDWRKNPYIIKDILRAADDLQQTVYFKRDGRWTGLCLGDIYYSVETRGVFIDFHPALIMPDDGGERAKRLNRFDFIDGSLFKDDSGFDTGRANFNFALASLIFYLMIGRYPYQGSLTDSFSVDTNEHEHTLWLERYHDLDVFIYDPDDDTNRRWVLREEFGDEEKWLALPEKIRETFIGIFKKNAGPGETAAATDAARWLELIKTLSADNGGN